MKFLGGVLMGMGILIAGLTGLCTGIMLLSGVTFSASGPALRDELIFVGTPLGIGIAMILLGRRIINRDNGAVP